MWPFDDIGDAIGGKLKELVSSAFETAMRGLWEGALWILRESFLLADRFSVFTVDTHSGPVSVLWPMMLWISGVLALGLFFWQLTMTSLRGGRGFMRLVGGPLQYGIALAVTVGMVALFLAAADGLTEGILRTGLQSSNFQDALNHTTFTDSAGDGISAVVLGICAFVGFIPAGIGYVLEMLFREAAVYLLVATIPITAAGLLANVTASWFWKTVRWLLSCIAMKPVLAMALVLGVAIAGGSQGLSGLLAGIGVLIIALLVPFVLFRLFAFVDPNSDAGGAFRDALSSVGVSSYGADNPAIKAASALTGIGGGGGGGDAQESANTGRFDEAMAGYSDDEMDTYGIGNGFGGQSSNSSSSSSSSSDTADADGPASNDSSDGASAASPANRGQVTSSDGIGPQGTGGNGGGQEPPPPEPPDHNGHGPSDDGGGGGGSPRGGGGGGPKTSGGGGGGASAGEAAEAAVIV